MQGLQWHHVGPVRQPHVDPVLPLQRHRRRGQRPVQRSGEGLLMTAREDFLVALLQVALASNRVRRMAETVTLTSKDVEVLDEAAEDLKAVAMRAVRFDVKLRPQDVVTVLDNSGILA